MEELRKRLFFVFGAILVYRIGTYIPVPGINPAALASFFEQQSGTIIDMFILILTLSGWVYISASSSISNSLHSTMRVTRVLYWGNRTRWSHIEISFGWLHIDHCFV